MPPVLITCYVDPDLDGFAGVMAYAEFLRTQGRDVVPGILGKPHDEVKYILNKFELTYPAEIINDANFSEVILVDASDLIGLEGRVVADKVVEIIDHRKINEADKFTNAKVQIEMVGAAATLITEKFIAQQITISKSSAILLYSAILSNTLNFKGSITTERDIKASAWLKQFIEISDDYAKDLFKAKSDLSGDKLITRIYHEFAQFVLGEKKIGLAQLEIVDARELVQKRGNEIIATLQKIKKDLGLDFIFQNLIDLENNRNFIISTDEDLKQILTQILNIKFIGDVAIREGLIMRKQIVPLLKEKIE